MNFSEQTPSNEPQPSPPADVPTEGGGPEVASEQWQALEARWRTILGLEGGLESLRQGVDGLRAEMESAFRQSLTMEEKLHALQSDVAQWTRAKSRVHYALPKAREFIHRATWATGVPERKRLEPFFRNTSEPRVPIDDVDATRDELEHLQKDRQVLIAQGNTVSQECRALIAEIRRTLSALQRNAANRARDKRSAGREKGKHF